jgi:hypothetical protein
MFFWFIGTSIATIWFVFHDKKFAYRLVVAGALAPDAIEVFLGHAGPLHSLVTMVAIMAAVMLITYGRKKSRSKMLASSLACSCTWCLTEHLRTRRCFGGQFQDCSLVITHYQCSIVGSSTFHLK